MFFKMKTLRNPGIFKTFMRAERKESSNVMIDNTFPATIPGPFDSLGYPICDRFLKMADTNY